MSVSYATFVLMFPEFATADVDEQSRITSFITSSFLEVNADAWGVRVDQGISYLTAHRLAMANRTKDSGNDGMSGAGPVISAKVDKLAVAFGISGGSVAGGSTGVLNGLEATSYGVEYNRMRSTLSITPLLLSND